MVFGREWRPRVDAGCWLRAVQRAASAFPPEPFGRAGAALGAVKARRYAATRISMASGLVRLKTRADFVHVAARGRRAVRAGFILQAASRPAKDVGGEAVRVGFTASRKVGNAVVRNRAKRRLRAAAARVLTRSGRPGTDYVIVARSATGDVSFAELVADLETALRLVDRGSRKDQLRRAEEV